MDIDELFNFHGTDKAYYAAMYHALLSTSASCRARFLKSV
jgi:hypothetical protein